MYNFYILNVGGDVGIAQGVKMKTKGRYCYRIRVWFRDHYDGHIWLYERFRGRKATAKRARQELLSMGHKWGDVKVKSEIKRLKGTIGENYAAGPF